MNFAHQVRTYGHIPNGNRTYYLSRSQPPFFHRMVALLAPKRPATAYAEFLPALRAEHEFWMQGAAQSTPEQAARRVVTMPDGSLLNRYWDARDVPRDESFREDVEAAEEAAMPTAHVSIAISARRRKAAGISAPAGSPTASPSRPRGRRPSSPSTSTACCTDSSRRSPKAVARPATADCAAPLRKAGGGSARGDAPLPVERGDRRLRRLVVDRAPSSRKRERRDFVPALRRARDRRPGSSELRRSSARNCSRTAGWSARTATPASSGMRRTAGRPCNGSP